MSESLLTETQMAALNRLWHRAERQKEVLPERSAKDLSFISLFLLPTSNLSETSSFLLLDKIFSKRSAVILNGKLFIAKEYQWSSILKRRDSPLIRNSVEEIVNIIRPDSDFASELKAMKSINLFPELEIRYWTLYS